MRKAIRLFLGRHDFKSFSAANGSARGPARGGQGPNTVRTVKHFKLKREGPLLVIRIEADGFLYHMVRNLTGALIEVGRGKMEIAELRGILEKKDRRLAPATAPPQGLSLVDVRYQ